MGENERERLIAAGSAARADGRPAADNPVYTDGLRADRTAGAPHESVPDPAEGADAGIDWLDRLMAWQFGWELEDALRASGASQPILALLAPFIAPDPDEGTA